MRVLSAGELLTVWEHGASQRPNQRALALLSVACADEATPDRLARLSIGQRDEYLLRLRERLFGPRLAATSSCPACKETLELEINAADIRVAAPASDPGEAIDLDYGDYEVRFRLPNNLDITSLDPEADNKTNRQYLLKQCVLTARGGGKDISADELPAEIVVAIADHMAQADPQADVQLALICPQCGHAWNSPLDIVSFFWSEINAWAIRLLNDVHILASAYGWRETDILSLSPTRRQTYLELIQG